MNTAANAGEVFSDSEEEMDEETRARHKEFAQKREAHYSREAAIALRRARELGNGDGDEDEDDEDETTEGTSEDDAGGGGKNREAPKLNGRRHQANGVA